jgi:hypothetical protein
MFSAVLRIMAFFLMVALHKGLTVAFAWTIPANLVGAQIIIDDLLFLAFLSVYLYLAYDMVAVFIPALKRKYPSAPEAVVSE